MNYMIATFEMVHLVKSMSLNKSGNEYHIVLFDKNDPDADGEYYVRRFKKLDEAIAKFNEMTALMIQGNGNLPELFDK